MLNPGKSSTQSVDVQIAPHWIAKYFFPMWTPELCSIWMLNCNIIYVIIFIAPQCLHNLCMLAHLHLDERKFFNNKSDSCCNRRWWHHKDKKFKDTLSWPEPNLHISALLYPPVGPWTLWFACYVYKRSLQTPPSCYWVSALLENVELLKKTLT